MINLKYFLVQEGWKRERKINLAMHMSGIKDPKFIFTTRKKFLVTFSVVQFVINLMEKLIIIELIFFLNF